jgi:hypothetical protein
MKKFRLFLLMLAIALISPAVMAQSASKSKYIKPTGFQKKVTTVVKGKSRNYYSLSATEPSLISFSGPGKLRMVTRARFVPGQVDKLAYEIVYNIDGAGPKSIKMSDVTKSTSATYLNGALGFPGELKDFELTLGRGNHSINFTLKDGKTPVAVQYIFTPTKAKKMDWVEFSPLRPSEPVEINSKETATTYYRASEENPVKIELIGPTELRVLTRVEYHFQMRGRVNYRVQVKENGKVINTYQLTTQLSEVAEYKDDKNLVPGKACEFVINVPAGKHLYELVPLDKDKNTVLSRFLLPKNDVKPVK